MSAIGLPQGLAVHSVKAPPAKSFTSRLFASLFFAVGVLCVMSEANTLNFLPSETVYGLYLFKTHIWKISMDISAAFLYI